ncbi:MAG: hypothetical protein OHK0039_05860 [Bacteroidia bacterium]
MRQQATWLKTWLHSALLSVLLWLVLVGWLYLTAHYLFPLPRGSGMQYVAHPFWVMVSHSLLSLLCFIVLVYGRYQPWRVWSLAALVGMVVAVLVFAGA